MKAAKRLCIALAAVGFGVTTARAAEAPAPSARVQALVAAMTPAEKVSQLQSSAPAIPRLGLPAYDWWSEGLHGLARNGYATVFPQAIGLAAAWDEDLMRRVGAVVSAEARAKFIAAGAGDHGRYGGLTIWSPNINIDRDPRWGRGQETYGEDPYLTGRLAVGFVQGLQGPDPAHPVAIATVKHFAVHSGPEAGRHGFDVDVSPQDLEATYLPAFRAAVTQGGVQSVMCAYNAVHGTPVCASPRLLDETLRRDWGFRGYVVSDCDAVDDMAKFHFYRPDEGGVSAAALSAGTDLDCGTAYASLTGALDRGLVAPQVVDQALIRLLSARERLGALGSSDEPRGPAPDPAAAARLALEAAEKSIVLLKNGKGRLPLPASVKLAVVGPNADALESLEANYHGTAVDPVTPLQALRAALGPSRVAYAQGSPIAEGVAVTVPETALRAGGHGGLKGEYFDGTDMTGAPTLVRQDRVIAFDWDRVAPAPGLNPKAYAVRWTGEIAPPGPGDYDLSLAVARCFDCKGHDRVRLYVDGALALDDPGDGAARSAQVRFDAGRPRAIRLELVHGGEDEGLRLQWRAPPDAQLAEARAAAASADAVVAFVGLSPDVEGEELKVTSPGFDGGDRTDLALPAPQRRLLETLAATGKPLVVVVMAGSALVLGEEAKAADAVLYAWYPGQAGGEAIARTLLGAANPSGRLPVTVYRSVRDLPAFTDYRMSGRTYRYFAGSPLYPFGFGLSYTRFAYAGLSLPPGPLAAGQPLTVRAQVRNVGDREGDEVAELYLAPPPAPGRPTLSLAGFRRVHLRPGETATLDFALPPRTFNSVDPQGGHAVEPGLYRLYLGGGQPRFVQDLSAEVTVVGRQALPR